MAAHEDAARRAVALWGEAGAVCMRAIAYAQEDAVVIVREFQVGYRTLTEPVRFMCLGRGATWDAAFADAAPFIGREEEKNAAADDGDAGPAPVDAALDRSPIRMPKRKQP